MKKKKMKKQLKLAYKAFDNIEILVNKHLNEGGTCLVVKEIGEIIGYTGL